MDQTTLRASLKTFRSLNAWLPTAPRWPPPAAARAARRRCMSPLTPALHIPQPTGGVTSCTLVEQPGRWIKRPAVLDENTTQLERLASDRPGACTRASHSLHARLELWQPACLDPGPPHTRALVNLPPAASVRNPIPRRRLRHVRPHARGAGGEPDEEVQVGAGAGGRGGLPAVRVAAVLPTASVLWQAPMPPSEPRRLRRRLLCQPPSNPRLPPTHPCIPHRLPT